MLVALIILIVSMADTWTSKNNFTVARHIKSAARTAALTLLIYVIYANVVDRLPIKTGKENTEESSVVNE
jgi:hypothetical protein